jgi:hypothetical protein
MIRVFLIRFETSSNPVRDNPNPGIWSVVMSIIKIDAARKPVDHFIRVTVKR